MKTTIGGSEMVGRIIHRNITLQQNISRHFLFQDDTAKMKAKPMANLIIRIQDWDVGKPKCFQLGPNPWCEQGRLFLAGHPSTLNMRLLFIMPEVSVSLLCRCVHTHCVCLLNLQHAYKSKTLVLQSKIVCELNVPFSRAAGAHGHENDKKGRFC